LRWWRTASRCIGVVCRYVYTSIPPPL
jgi:hypothetical protein